MRRCVGEPSRTIRLPSDALDWNALRRQHLVLKRVHGRSGLVDAPHECDRPLQNGLEPLAILKSGLGVLVFDDERRVDDVDRFEIDTFARKKLFRP